LDISIFRDSLLSHLGDSRIVEVDDNYPGECPRYIKCPAGFSNPEKTLFIQQKDVHNRKGGKKNNKDGNKGGDKENEDSISL